MILDFYFFHISMVWFLFFYFILLETQEPLGLVLLKSNTRGCISIYLNIEKGLTVLSLLYFLENWSTLNYFSKS